MKIALPAVLVLAMNPAIAGSAAAPLAAAAPTLGEFGLIALAIAVGAAGGFVMRRREK